MSAQQTYGYQTPKGIAGGLFDISPYRIDSRSNGEETPGALLYGMGVVQGESPGKNILKPTATDEPDVFEGVAMTGFTTQMDMLGKVTVMPRQTIGILRWGKAWVRVADGVVPEYGEPLHLIVDGAEAGFFTNDDTGDVIAIKGRFVGGLGTGNIAPVEIFNQMQE